MHAWSAVRVDSRLRCEADVEEERLIETLREP
jgi:hypothetical protein